MSLIIKVFFFKKAVKLILIALTVSLISLIFFFSLFLQSSLQDFLIANHLGAIPSLSIALENPISPDEAQSLDAFAHAHLKVDAVRKGFRHQSSVRVGWAKGSLIRSTKFEAVFIGWHLPAPLLLTIKFENRLYQVPCLKIHPARGFYIPVSALSNIGSPIEVISLSLDTMFSREYPLNLNVVLRKKTESINGIDCKRYGIPTPQYGCEPQAEIDFRNKEQRLYEIIGDFLSNNLGQNLARSMNSDLRLAQYRFFNGEAMCIPSIQIWEDICGIGLSDRASFKKFEFYTSKNSYPHKLKTYGFLNTRYGADQNGYVIYLEINQMQSLFDWQQLPGINFFEMDIPHFSPQDNCIDRLAEFLPSLTNSGFNIIPWWDRCDQKTVKFITRTVDFVRVISAVILFFGFFGMYHTCMRFGNEVQCEWRPTAILFGASTMQILKMLMYYILFIVLAGLGLFWAVLIGTLALPVELFGTYNWLIFPLGRIVSMGIGFASIGMLSFSFASSFARWRLQILTTTVMLILAIISTFIEFDHFGSLSSLFLPLSIFFVLETVLHAFRSRLS